MSGKKCKQLRQELRRRGVNPTQPLMERTYRMTRQLKQVGYGTATLTPESPRGMYQAAKKNLKKAKRG